MRNFSMPSGRCGQRALLLAKPGHVRIAEHGHAIGSEREDLIDGVRETLGGLVGQAVDQVHVDALEAKLARLGDQFGGHFQRLHAIHRLLHLGIEILNAHAQAVEAQPAQRFQMLARW